jgi:hypothetical protein
LQINLGISIASIWTCFAEEFTTYLKENPDAGTYLYQESNVFNSSANCGRVYTIKNLRQIIEYSLGSFELVLCDNPKSFKADNRHVKRKK